MRTASSRATALARLAFFVLVIGLLVAASVADDGSLRSLAQEGAATPGTSGTPVPIADFDQLVAERPVEIHAGSCTEPGATVASLTPMSTSEGEAVGQGAAIEAERSYTIVPIAIDAILGGQNSVSVFLSDGERDVTIVCGEIGGVPSEGGSVVVKLSERNGSGFTGIAFLAPADAGTSGVSIFLAGQRTVAETRDLVAAATPEATLEAIPEPTPTAEALQVVDVVLLEWLIDLPEEIRAGQANLVVTNEGAESHGLVIEGPGGVFELPAPLEPGETTVLNAVLPAGEYILYCPVGDGAHRESGMEATLSVVP